MWVILARLGIPDKLIRILKALHEKVEVKINMDGEEAVIISIRGVKQGDILGPVLYKLFQFAVMYTNPRR